MSYVMIIYAGRYGQTQKIAERIADRLRAKYHAVELANALSIDPRALEHMDAIILGSSVRVGKHMPELRELATDRRHLLSRKTSAFFSVCTTSASDTKESRETAASYVERFAENTGWRPAQVASFAGALKYLDYWFPLRFIMKQIAKRTGASTDTSRNHEYTQWDQVDAFADAFDARLVSGRPNLTTPAPTSRHRAEDRSPPACSPPS